MRAMILILLFLIALPELGIAEAPGSGPELLSGPDLYDELGVVPPELGAAKALPDKGSRAAQNNVPAPPEGFEIERQATGIDGTAELSDSDVGLGPFSDLPNAPAVSERAPKRGWIGGIIEEVTSPEAMAAREKDPRQQACNKSKTEMQKYENCWLQLIREFYIRQYPPDLVELLITKLRLAEKKRITGKISKEEADVLRAEAHVQFQNGVASRTSVVRQEERGRDDQERQLQLLDREIKRSERDSQRRESEYQTERLRRELEAQERERARSERGLFDQTRPSTSLPTQTYCYPAPGGAINCITR
mgnify:CR=1 FL=1